MPRSLHVRLDEAASAALEIVRAESASDSEAVRIALQEAAQRRRTRAALAAEVAALAANVRDVEEMRAVREAMDELALRDEDIG